MAQGEGKRPWIRGSEVDRALRNDVLASGDIIATDEGNLYVGSGTKEIKNISPMVKISDINNINPIIDFAQFPDGVMSTVQINTGADNQNTIAIAPNGNIYVVWWNSSRNVIIGQWHSLTRTWSTTDLSGQPGNPIKSPAPNDDHNQLAIAVDGDGYIHISGNHHGDNLRYAKSINPNDISSWTISSMVGSEELRVTYPRFINLPNGDLLFNYRNGESGSGDHYINRYNKNTKTWIRIAHLFKGSPPVTPDESCYPSRFIFKNGVIHLIYTWRENDQPTSVHDLYYIKSSDEGLTWTTMSGTNLTLPITPSIVSSRFMTGTPPGFVNGFGSSIDSSGIVHAAMWLASSSGGDMKDLHHWYFFNGEWHDDILISHIQGGTRVGVWSSLNGKTYALYSKGSRATAIRIWPTTGKEVEIFSFPVHQWEASINDDSTQNVLKTIIAPSASSLTGGSWGGMLSVSTIAMDGLNSEIILPKPITPQRIPTPVQIGETPMRPGLYYSPPGLRSSNTIGNLAIGEWRGALLTIGRNCHIAASQVKITAPGSIGSQWRVVIFDYLTKNIIGYSSIQDGTITGNREVSTEYDLLQGQIIAIGVQLISGTTAPSIGAIVGTGWHDYRIGYPTIAGALNNASYAGVSATFNIETPPNYIETFAPVGNTILVSVKVTT